MIDLALTSRQKLALRALALVSTALVFASATHRPACAQTPIAAASVTAPAPLKLFPDSRMITRDRISVEVVGSGPDIVLIPGLASSRETWRHTAERLRGRYRLHLVQVAGFAGELARANASGPFFDPVLAEIDAYCATLPKPPVVLGHSLGGTLALALAERHPGHVGRLLIVDALPFLGAAVAGPSATPEAIKPLAEMIAMRTASATPEQYAAMSHQSVAGMVTASADVERVAAWGRASSQAVVGRAMADDMETDLRAGLAQLKVPTALFYPAAPSETTSPAAYQAAYATVPAVKLVPFENSRHFIMYDQPARFDAEVDAFLKR